MEVFRLPGGLPGPLSRRRSGDRRPKSASALITYPSPSTRFSSTRTSQPSFHSLRGCAELTRAMAMVTPAITTLMRPIGSMEGCCTRSAFGVIRDIRAREPCRNAGSEQPNEPMMPKITDSIVAAAHLMLLTISSHAPCRYWLPRLNDVDSEAVEDETAAACAATSPMFSILAKSTRRKRARR